MFEIINDSFSSIECDELGCYCDCDMCSCCDDGDDPDYQ